jgi:putative redox protein
MLRSFSFGIQGFADRLRHMVEIDIKYQGDLRCEAIHGPSKQRLLTDAPVDNQGKGEAFSPTDLCATAFGACMAMIMGIQARDLEIDLKGMTVHVEKTMSSDLPRRISQLDVDISVPGALSEKHRTQLILAAEHCPVHYSLHPDIWVNLNFQWEASHTK